MEEKGTEKERPDAGGSEEAASRYETMKEAGYRLVRSLGGGEVLLLNTHTGKTELWVAHKDHASYGLIYKNTHLEFVREWGTEDKLWKVETYDLVVRAPDKKKAVEEARRLAAAGRVSLAEGEVEEYEPQYEGEPADNDGPIPQPEILKKELIRRLEIRLKQLTGEIDRGYLARGGHHTRDVVTVLAFLRGEDCAEKLIENLPDITGART